MATPISKNHAAVDALYRVKRGISAYVSYLAACEMNEAFSEYVLYEPILRILMARGFSVQCEYECPGIEQPGRGDKKRLDFFAVGHDIELGIEVKWVKSRSPCSQADVEKLQGSTPNQKGPRFFVSSDGSPSLRISISTPAYLRSAGALSTQTSGKQSMAAEYLPFVE